jgi:hypothetical protein
MQKQTIIRILSACALLISCTASLWALEPSGNDRKGKYLYRKMAQTCFTKGQSESEKPKLDPSSKTQGQWDLVFSKKDFSCFVCPSDWEALKDEDLLNIFTYLYKHAADSPTPAKCK